jgi:hypothetical protein
LMVAQRCDQSWKLFPAQSSVRDFKRTREIIALQ